MKHKLKNLIVLTILFFSPLIVQASKSTVYRDHFTITAPSSVRILYARTQDNLKITPESTTSFILSSSDTGSTNPGDLILDVGYDNDNKCTLIIHDGPFEMNASVLNVEHFGFKLIYDGMEHAYGTHEYKLRFRQIG